MSKDLNHLRKDHFRYSVVRVRGLAWSIEYRLTALFPAAEKLNLKYFLFNCGLGRVIW